MANTPMTRPPGRPRSERRKPKGRPVALSPKDQDIHDRLVAASTKLNQVGEPGLAEAVDLVLTPEGAAFVGRLRVERHTQAIESGDAFPNLPVSMETALRDRLKAAAKAEKASLTDEAHEALRRFVAGDFRPTRPKRSEYGAGTEKVNLNLRIDPELRRQADEAGKELADELGWKPLASHVIRDWLVHRFPAAASASGQKQ